MIDHGTDHAGFSNICHHLQEEEKKKKKTYIWIELGVNLCSPSGFDLIET
jgi:hypothetical protein